MAYDGSIVFCTKLDNSQIEKDLNELERKIQKAEGDVTKSENAQAPLIKELEEYSAKLSEARTKLRELKAEQSTMSANLQPGSSPEAFMEAYSRKGKIDADVAAQEAEVEKLKNAWDKVSKQIEKYDAKIQMARDSIAQNSAAASVLNAKLASKNSERMATALNVAHASAAKFGNRLMAIGKTVLVFSLVRNALYSIVSYMGKALRTNSEYTAQLAKLKGALLTAFQPIYEWVLPGLLAVLKVLTAIVQVFAHVLSIFSRKSTAQSSKNAKSLYEEANAIGAVGSAAKKASKDLASFDEIQRVGTDTDTGGGGGGASVGGITPDFSDFSTDEYKSKIDELTIYLSGALLALGAILAFSGANIPLGIALMAAGAIGLAAEIKENWGAMSAPVKKALTNVLTVLGGAAFAIGAILAFSGASVPKGIALMVLGAAALGGSATINWNTISNALKGPVGKIVAIASGALLALGMILAISGAAVPLGIGLIIAGAAGLATTAALNWDVVSQYVDEGLGTLLVCAGSYLLGIGLILALSGAALPLGIGLMVAGAAVLGGGVAINWDMIRNNVDSTLGKILAIASAASLVLGIILVCTGVGTPLGISLIMAGAAGLVSVAALDWNAIQNKCKDVWNNIKNWFNSSVKPKLTLAYWKEKFANIGEGLKQKLKDGVNAGITLFNRFISWINSKMKISWGALNIAGQQIVPAGSVQLLKLPSIPYLAKGAVLPANKPFLAMVGDQKHGTNVEAPLATIEEAVANVLSRMGNVGNEQIIVLLQEILQAILGIEIDGETISKAVDNYKRKIAVVKGG